MLSTAKTRLLLKKYNSIIPYNTPLKYWAQFYWKKDDCSTIFSCNSFKSFPRIPLGFYLTISLGNAPKIYPGAPPMFSAGNLFFRFLRIHLEIHWNCARNSSKDVFRGSSWNSPKICFIILIWNSYEDFYSKNPFKALLQ